ncbi:hypothetical protein GQ472_01600 [archaeon]|nr:hypothetical protein [archaeon]
MDWKRISNRMDIIGCAVASALVVFYVFAVPMLYLLMSGIGILYTVMVFLMVTGMVSLYIGTFMFLRNQTAKFDRVMERRQRHKKVMKGQRTLG